MSLRSICTVALVAIAATVLTAALGSAESPVWLDQALDQMEKVPGGTAWDIQSRIPVAEKFGFPRNCDDYDFFRSPFFGDLHVHTSYSMDTIYFGGSTTADPTAAYDFARGLPIGLPPFDAAGNPARFAQLDRPLDFAAVTDHAEYFGEVRICYSPGHPGYDAPECVALRQRNPAAGFPVWFGPLAGPPGAPRFDFCDEGDANCLDVAGNVWEDTRAAAMAADDPTSACSFSTFVGYEWTGNAFGANLHRNVIFKSDQVPEIPVSYLDAPQVEQLHDSLQADCLEGLQDCDAVVIPHNSNYSMGRMFLPQTADGTPFDAESAARRAQFEPLVEIMQHKGASECRPGLGTTDELCAFEVPATSSLLPIPNPPPVESLSFVRNALKLGLELDTELGVNPFQMGFVGGTDTHNAAAGFTEEDSYQGHLAALESVLPGRLNQVGNNPGGLTVIWAEENSRESLFEALQRREVYATSGNRPVVRFFGGHLIPDNLCSLHFFAPLGYLLGVPMGGVLDAPHGLAWNRAPRFAVSALMDPGTSDSPGHELERIQIVKAWVENDVAQERVIDVVGGRGESSEALCAVWADPDYDPSQVAFYYARVLEVPSEPWYAQQCSAAGVVCSEPALIPPGLERCCSEFRPPQHQERAWTSPIWMPAHPPFPGHKSADDVASSSR